MNSWYHRLRSSEAYHDKGIDIFAQDWDTLIILDACRYDEYLRQRPAGGELRVVTSRAGATNEFLRANFTGRELHDTVYVSGNPWYARLRDELNSSVFRFVNVRGKHEVSETDGLDELTVGPGPVSAAARRSLESHPNKRHIVHYIQPHTPYIGPTGREHFEITRGMWNQVNASEVSDEVVRRAYRENLELVLEEVEELVNEIPGKTVVTADHGEYLGERSAPIPVRTYGHFVGLYTDPLVKVPWHVFVNGERPSIVEEESVSDDADSLVEDQLQALGYRL